MLKEIFVDRPPHRVVFNALTAWPRLAALFALLIAGPAFAEQVTLTWDPVASPLLAGYRVHYGPAAGNYAWSVDAGNTTVLQVGSLTEGATYHFAVTAYDATGGESAYSNDVGTVIPYTAPYTAPVAAFSANVTSGTAPLALTFLNQSTGNITAYKWDFGDGTNGTTENPTHVYPTAGVYTVSLTVAGPDGSNTQTRNDYLTVTTPTPGATSGTGLLDGDWAASAANVDLPGVGTSDWAKWPEYVHSASGLAQISDATVTGNAAVAIDSGDPRTITWSNGYPTATGASHEALSVSGFGNGFRFTAAADTTTRTLFIYVGLQHGTGTLTARLSDGSAADYVSAYSGWGTRDDGVYTLTYRAASSGQTLSVDWTQTGTSQGGSISLQGAALVGSSIPAPQP